MNEYVPLTVEGAHQLFGAVRRLSTLSSKAVQTPEEVQEIPLLAKAVSEGVNQHAPVLLSAFLFVETRVKTLAVILADLVRAGAPVPAPTAETPDNVTPLPKPQ